MLTTHYLEEAAALAGRLAVLAGGRVVATGTPAALGGADRPTRVGWDSADGRRTVQTPTPTQVVAELARQFGGEVPGLTVNRPTLEDTYLELIGDLGGGGMTTTTQARPRTAGPVPLPSLLTAGRSRGRIEVTTFFRERETVVFIFALPAVLLLLLGSIFNSEHVQVPGVTTGQLYAAGMIAGGIMATSFQYLGISVAIERTRACSSGCTGRRCRTPPISSARSFRSSCA